MTAREEALEVGLTEVAKTIVVTTAAGTTPALPASRTGRRLPYVPTRCLRRCFGGPHTDRTVIDRCVAIRESVVLDAGSHEKSGTG